MPTQSPDQFARARNWATVTKKSTGFRQRAREITRHCALDLASLTMHQSAAPALRCLLVHTVFDDQAAAFRRMMEAIQTRGKFIDTERCLRIVHGEEPVEEPLFHLSFDDGYMNNFDNAVPILTALNIPTLFFVTTSLMNSPVDWRREFSMEYGGFTEVLDFMSWDNLREVASRGHTIGCHTIKHPRLSTIAADSKHFEREVLDSKTHIERELGTECRYFSWPYGQLSDISQPALKQIKRFGYAACFGGFRGTVKPGQTDPYCIPRHQIDPDWPVRHAMLFAQGRFEHTGRASPAE